MGSLKDDFPIFKKIAEADVAFEQAISPPGGKGVIKEAASRRKRSLSPIR
jgi:hypothetical protein